MVISGRKGHNLYEWTPRLGDDEGFALDRALNETRKVGFGLVNVDDFQESHRTRRGPILN